MKVKEQEVLPMNEFEKEMLSMMKAMQTEITEMKAEMNEQFKKVNERLDALEETAEITRGATNYNCEKLDELTQELKRSHLIA